MGVDRKFLLCGLLFAISGLCLGIYMAASRNHSEMPAHAHIMLVGFVFSFIYATIHRLWLPGITGKLKSIQFFLHEIGAVLLAVGLLLLFSGHGSEDSLAPMLGGGATCVLLGMLAMTWMVMRARPTA